MKIEDFNQKLADKFGCKFNKQYTGSAEWKRIFILKGKVSIGRLSFKNQELKFKKFYKPYNYDLAEEDKIIIRLFHFIKTGNYITSKEYDNLFKNAKKMRNKDIKKKTQWRIEHPIKEKIRKIILPNDRIKIYRTHRKKIHGRSVRSCLLNLIRNENY